MDEKKNKLQQIQHFCMLKNDGDTTDSRLCIINYEFEAGFKFMQKYPQSVTFFGSARLPEDNEYSLKATRLAEKISNAGYAIVTGGGNGIMKAANKGAFQAKGHSIGLNIELPHEQVANEFLTDLLSFHHFYSRKVTLTYSSEAYIYFPGGFGTLDELFEVLTLKQTKKIPNIPIILFGSEFWNPLKETIKHMMIDHQQTISPEDMDLFIITDDMDEALDAVIKSPLRTEEALNIPKKFFV